MLDPDHVRTGPTTPPEAPLYTILVVTELALDSHDVTRVATLHGDEPVRAHILVPADTTHNRLLEALDEAALGRLRDAFEDSGDATPGDAELAAQHAIGTSIDALAAAGVTATGAVTADDPVPAALEAAKSLPADEVLVFTTPHLVRESLHRDWSSRLRDHIDLPVLHVVAGTDRVVS